jgi:3-hydroxyacyl-[acyl-carrier-protein] dehydratase
MRYGGLILSFYQRCRDIPVTNTNCTKATLERMETTDILKLLPHRYPFLLVDRIIDMDGDSSATGIKNVTIDEPYFQGSFPNNPVMPTMLLLEGMAQTAGALCMHHLKVKESPLIYFMSIDKARLRRPVRPGDTVHYRVEKFAIANGYGDTAGGLSSTGLVAQAEFSAAIVETGSPPKVPGTNPSA